MKRLILLMHCPDKKGIIAARHPFYSSIETETLSISTSMSIAVHQGAFFMRSGR